MGIEKLMTYGRYVLAIVLVIYLLLVWMYFKDNATQLTSSSLLLWFVAIPLALFATIMFLRWRQKKLAERKDAPLTSKVELEALPEKYPAYSLYLHSSFCLPEGDNGADIRDNNTDVTSLSETLTDFEGIPILIKPISSVTNEAALSYFNSYSSADIDDSASADDSGYSYDDDSGDNENELALDELSLRVWALIHEQFLLSEESLSLVAQHFSSVNQTSYEPNSALHIHPEWQQHYIVSAEDEETLDDSNLVPLTAQLNVHLCIPSLADTEVIAGLVKHYLMDYGIPETLFTIEIVLSDTVANSTESSTQNTELKMVHALIEDSLATISQLPTPAIRLFITADSQINEQWLESNYDSDAISSPVPTEASALLLFCNKPAYDTLALSDFLALTMIPVTDLEPSNHIRKEPDTLSPTNNRQQYARNLNKIKKLLSESLLLAKAEEFSSDTPKKSPKPSKDQPTLDVNALMDKNITLLSDINPTAQPYDVSVFMDFIDAIVAQGALVNEHHLGHYMPLNLWLKSFLSLASLYDMASSHQQESDLNILITQHQQGCILWLVNASA